MPKWKRQDETVCMHGTVKCANAEDDADAQYIVTMHNADIDALTAERDELQRRLDAVVAMLEPGSAPCDCITCDCGNIGNAKDMAAWEADKWAHARAVAIAEGRDNG